MSIQPIENNGLHYRNTKIILSLYFFCFCVCVCVSLAKLDNQIVYSEYTYKNYFIGMLDVVKKSKSFKTLNSLCDVGFTSGSKSRYATLSHNINSTLPQLKNNKKNNLKKLLAVQRIHPHRKKNNEKCKLFKSHFATVLTIFFFIHLPQ